MTQTGRAAGAAAPAPQPLVRMCPVRGTQPAPSCTPRSGPPSTTPTPRQTHTLRSVVSTSSSEQGSVMSTASSSSASPTTSPSCGPVTHPGRRSEQLPAGPCIPAAGQAPAEPGLAGPGTRAAFVRGSECRASPWRVCTVSKCMPERQIARRGIPSYQHGVALGHGTGGGPGPTGRRMGPRALAHSPISVTSPASNQWDHQDQNSTPPMRCASGSGRPALL